MSDRLYHYTSPQGLIGIISKRSLWATDALFLNDSREIAWGVELAQGQLREFHGGLSSLERNGEASRDEIEQLKRAEWLIKDIRHIGTTNSKSVFVSSLSEKPDLLSQWRAYCRGGGFSIGFPKDWLQRWTEDQKFSLEKCVYLETEQRTLLQETLQQVAIPWIRDSHVPVEEDNDRFKISGQLKWDLIRVCARLKHSSFSEEAEWRIVSRPEHAPTVKELEFRPSGGRVVPYFVVELPDHTVKDFWREVRIVVGPTPTPDATKAGVQDLLRKFSEFAPVVTVTETPFREW